MLFMCVRERARGYVDKPSVTHRRRANGESSPAATRPHYTPTFGFCFFFSLLIFLCQTPYLNFSFSFCLGFVSFRVIGGFGNSRRLGRKMPIRLVPYIKYYGLV